MDHLEIPVPCGERWRDIARGKQLPEHEIMRIKTFLSGMSDDDLVYTYWYGPTAPPGRARCVSRLVIVGQDGAGRRLRSTEDYTPEPAELLDDVASVYFHEISRDDDPRMLRYVIMDFGSDESEPALVTRRDEFIVVCAELHSVSSTASVWMGSRHVPAHEWESVDEDEYLFSDDLVSRVHQNTSGFLASAKTQALGAWGIAPRRGVLLHGRPGNGKTILSRIAAKRAIAAGINVVFLTVGALARGAGDNLRVAASRAPVLIVIDDIDVHCGKREGAGDVRTNSTVRQRFLADLLEFLDGVSSNAGYVLLATTNAIDDLDPALRRPGRLDVHIGVLGPPSDHRRRLLQRDTAIPDGEHPDVEEAVRVLDGCSYADVAELSKRYKIAVVNRHESPAVDQELLDHTAQAFAVEGGMIEVSKSVTS
jgi:hypothetical protein